MHEWHSTPLHGMQFYGWLTLSPFGPVLLPKYPAIQPHSLHVECITQVLGARGQQRSNLAVSGSNKKGN